MRGRYNSAIIGNVEQQHNSRRNLTIAAWIIGLAILLLIVVPWLIGNFGWWTCLLGWVLSAMAFGWIMNELVKANRGEVKRPSDKTRSNGQ